MLHEIITSLDSLDKTYTSAKSRLLKAKATALLGQTELAYKPTAISRLDSLIAGRNCPEPIYFRAVIEKIKLIGRARPGNLDKLVDRLAESNCAEDFELVLSLAYLRRQLNYAQAF